MDVDFVIPLSRDDLLSGQAGSYVVDEVLSVRVLPNKLRGKLLNAAECNHYRSSFRLGLIFAYQP